MDGRIAARRARGAATFARDRGCASAGSAAAFERGHPAGGGLSSWGHRKFLHAHCAGKRGAVARSKHALLPVLRGDDVCGVRRLRSSISATLRPHGSHYAACRAPCFDALVPAIAGMAVRRFRPDFAIKCARRLRNLSFAGVGFLLMFVLVSRRGQMTADWQPAFLAANAFIIPALVVGLVFARVLRLGASDSFTTGVLFAVRNVGPGSGHRNHAARPSRICRVCRRLFCDRSATLVRRGRAVPALVGGRFGCDESASRLGVASMKLTKRKSRADSYESDETLQVWMREATDLKAALDEHAIVAITDAQGRITFVNDKFCAVSRIFARGIARTGSPHHQFRAPSEGVFPRSLATITHGGVWHGEIRNRAKDGTFYWVATTIVPFLDEARETAAVRGHLRRHHRAEAGRSRAGGKTAPPAVARRAFDALRRAAIRARGCGHRGNAAAHRRDARAGSQHALAARGGGAGHGLHALLATARLAALPPRFATEDKLPWAQAKVVRGESFCFASMDDLPPEAARDAERFRLHGPKSNVTIPLIANGQVFGALAFATLEAERKWRLDEIAELKLIAQIIGNVVGRQRAETARRNCAPKSPTPCASRRSASWPPRSRTS